MHLAIFDGYRYTGKEPNLSTDDAWTFALDEPAFGPRWLVVVAAGQGSGVLGLAHGQQTDPPELALKGGLDGLDDAAAAAASTCCSYFLPIADVAAEAF